MYLFSHINELYFSFSPHTLDHFFCAAVVTSSKISNNLDIMKRFMKTGVNSIQQCFREMLYIDGNVAIIHSTYQLFITIMLTS